MHTFQPYPLDMFELDPFTKIGKEWMLVTSGTEEKANALTASWGGLGVLWGKNVVYIFIRKTRYTKEFIDANDTFSLTCFDAKYKNKDSKTVIPANISKMEIEEIRKLAIKAFNAVDGSGLARVDFFIKEADNKIYINEINTMPGFTQISMYPKLWEQCGIKYSDLLDKLIDSAKK